MKEEKPPPEMLPDTKRKGLERLADFTRAVLAVPKAELEKRERAWKASRKKKRARKEKTVTRVGGTR